MHRVLRTLGGTLAAQEFIPRALDVLTTGAWKMSDWASDELARIRREFQRKEVEKRAQEHHIQYADLTKFKPEPDALALVPRDIALKHIVLPLKKQDGVLFLAVTDPGDLQASDELRLVCRCTIRPVMSSREEIHDCILKCYPPDPEETASR